MTVEVGTAFHRQGRMNDVTFNPGGRSELDLTGADGAFYLAADDNGFGNHFTID